MSNAQKATRFGEGGRGLVEGNKQLPLRCSMTNDQESGADSANGPVRWVDGRERAGLAADYSQLRPAHSPSQREYIFIITRSVLFRENHRSTYITET